jgi:hypothetical protein
MEPVGVLLLPSNVMLVVSQFNSVPGASITAVGDDVSMVMLILVLSVQPLVGSVTVRLYRDAAVTLRVGEVLPSDHR